MTLSRLIERSPARRGTRATLRGALVVLIASALVVVGLPTSATAATPRDSFDAQMVQLVNQARAQEGLRGLVHSADLRRLSTYWSTEMATGQTNCRLAHNPDAWNQLPEYGAASRTTWSENVGSWATDQYSPQSIFDLYMASPGHRANILGKNARFIGVATVTGTRACAGTDYQTITFTDRVDNPGNVVPAAELPAGTVSFGADMPTDARVGGSFTPAIAAGLSTATPVLTASGACSHSGGVVTFDSIGTCTLTLDQAGDALWGAAPQVTAAFEVHGSPQTVSFTSGVPAQAGKWVAYPVAAQATSGLPVAITVSGDCTLQSGDAGSGTVTLTGTTPCTVTAAQSGDGAWLPAAPVSHVWRVPAGTRSDLAISVTPDSASGLTGPVTATVTVRNNGTRDSGPATTRVVVSHDVVDAGGATVTAAGGTAASRTLTWIAPTVRAGESVTYWVVLSAPAKSVALRARVSAGLPDATPTDNAAARLYRS